MFQCFISLLVWQNFMRLLYEHLRDVEDIDEFYYSLLELCSYKFEKQNPKRIIIEAYLDILIVDLYKITMKIQDA